MPIIAHAHAQSIQFPIGSMLHLSNQISAATKRLDERVDRIYYIYQ